MRHAAANDGEDRDPNADIFDVTERMTGLNDVGVVIPSSIPKSASSSSQKKKMKSKKKPTQKKTTQAVRKKVPTQVTPMVNAITFEDGDFLPEPEELQHLQEHLDKYKHKHEVLSDRIYVYTNNVRRTYVPRRTRGALLFTAHGPAHVGENHITALLYHYYWPYKLKEIRTYLRGCRCSSLKAAGVATKESSKSRASKKIKARNFLDIVQIDVYKYDGYHYLTFVDVATGKCWVKKIIKVNVAKKNKGLYKQRLTNCYRTWESELQAIPDEVSINKIPKKLHVDNETSLLQLPHPNIDASPVYYAQSNSKVERLHRTLANLSRINSTTPDKIQGLVNDTFTSGGGIKDKEREEGDDNDDDTESEDEKVPYDGRVLKEGQYVRAKVNLRSRNKQDPFWGGVAKVTERKGRKQYYIYDGNRVTLRHISHLKNYDIGEKLLEDVKVNPTVWERAMPCLGPRPKFDVEYGNNKVRVNDDWRMKIVYLGYPGLRNMERVAMKIKDGKYQLLYLAVPDLPFEHWYKVLGDLDAEGWYGHEPKDEGEFWVSDKGDKVREESITWWLVKFRKR
eukprot:jgi/Bigna1/144554/aug1.88_g19262